MEMNHKRLFLLLIFCHIFIEPAYSSESAWVVNKGSVYVEMQPTYATYESDNSRIHEWSLNDRLEIGWFDRSILFLSVPFRTLTTQSATPLTNNGLTDFHLGSYVQVLDEPFVLTLKGAVKIPSGYDVTFLPSIGDRQPDLEAGILAGYAFEAWSALMQAGVTYRYRLPYDPKHSVVVAAKARGEDITKPADQIEAFLEAGIWLGENVFVSLSTLGDFALPQSQAWQSSWLVLSPLVAYRLNPYLDVSLKFDQTLWSLNAPFSTGFQVGVHFHFDTHLPKEIGLRGE